MSESPESVGPYAIERRLGIGGMGTVYLGRHTETDQLVAVKVLSALLARETGFVERFHREIEALKQLKNPHVVELYESGTDGETYYYSMEYVAGETLTERLRREDRLDWEEVIRISVEVCVALKAAHDAGIIHRDLKPGNLMLDTDSGVKLTDFGVAQLFAASRLTATGGILGTAEYMSPEQAEGRRATKTSDLYSLGAVMYTMLTGRPPFTGRTTLDVIRRQRYGRFDPPREYVPEIPHWLDEIVCRLLEKDPDDRFPDAYVLSLRLKEVPKKIALSRGSLTEIDSDYDSEAETRAVGGGRTPEAGSATLMRDMVKDEVERMQQPGRFGRLFSNTWVLVGLLALVLLLGLAMWQARIMTPEQKFAAGVELLDAANPDDVDWRMARDRYLLPLRESDPERWSSRVQPHLDRIESYELKARFKRRRPANEVERFVLMAWHYHEMGDYARAARTLDSVLMMVKLAGDGESETYRDAIQLARQLRDELPTAARESESELVLLAGALDAADRMRREGRHDEAAAVYRAMIELYGDDLRAADAVERARRALAHQETAGR